jgi:hypothetical protein
MLSVLENPKIKSLPILPDVRPTGDGRNVCFHMYNRLGAPTVRPEGDNAGVPPIHPDQAGIIPAFVWPDGDVDQPGYAVFSTYVNNVDHIPLWTVFADGKKRPNWIPIPLNKDSFKLKDGERIIRRLPIKYREDGKRIFTTEPGIILQDVEVTIDPRVLYMDVYTANLLEDRDVGFHIDEANALRIDRILVQDTVEQGKKKRGSDRKNRTDPAAARYQQDAEWILGANAAIGKRIEEWKNVMSARGQPVPQSPCQVPQDYTLQEIKMEV